MLHSQNQLFSDCSGIYGTLLFVSAFSFKLNNTIYFCEQSVIAANTNIVAGMDLCASLSVQDKLISVVPDPEFL